MAEVNPQAASPAGIFPTQEVHVIVRDGKLAGIRVGNQKPTLSFARSRDYEYKWTKNQRVLRVGRTVRTHRDGHPSCTSPQAGVWISADR